MDLLYSPVPGKVPVITCIAFLFELNKFKVMENKRVEYYRKPVQQRDRRGGEK